MNILLDKIKENKSDKSFKSVEISNVVEQT